MTTDFRALCVELTDCLEKADWPHRYKVVFQQWTDIAHAALAEPEGEEPTDEELRELWQNSWDTSEEDGAFQFARAVLAYWGNYPGSPDSSDGPAVSDDREPASVIDQLKYQLFLKVKADLIREVINQALKDTASVHWRVTDTGEQIVRVGDLLRWAEQAANKIEQQL
jgi:hypothetical protein